MFKQRLLTALILIPLVLMAIYYANNTTLALLVLLLIGALGWEWLQLIPIKHWLGRCAFITLLLFLIWPAVYWLKVWLIVDLIFWGLILGILNFFASGFQQWGIAMTTANKVN